MKNTIYTLAIVTTLFAGSVFTGCQSQAQKEESAKANVRDAKQELNAVQNDGVAQKQELANADEWKAFRRDAELKIADNESRIAELKVKMKKSGKALDSYYSKRIDKLEQKNKDLKARINSYEKNRKSDWESFKSEFSHDMDELGNALKDLTINNKK